METATGLYRGLTAKSYATDDSDVVMGVEDLESQTQEALLADVVHRLAIDPDKRTFADVTNIVNGYGYMSSYNIALLSDVEWAAIRVLLKEYPPPNHVLCPSKRFEFPEKKHRKFCVIS